jgi:dipeptide/tripeptide permease
MSQAAMAGALILGIPLYITTWLLLRKQPRQIFLFAVVLLAVGIGYLAAVGATADIANRLVPQIFDGKAALKAAIPAQAPSKP